MAMHVLVQNWREILQGSSETALWEKIKIVVELEDTWDFEE